MNREQAEQIARKYFPDSSEYTVQDVMDAIMEAVAVEREECAKECDQIEFISLNNCCERTASSCADAIRARGEIGRQMTSNGVPN